MIKTIAALLACVILPAVCAPHTKTGADDITAELQVTRTDGAFCTDAVIYVNCGGRRFSLSPPCDSGYEPSLVIADFTGDDLGDVYYNVGSGGSGAFSYSCIYDFSGPLPKIIFDSAAAENGYSAQYTDGYKVKVSNGARDFFIDVSADKTGGLSRLYSDGKLIRPVTADVSAVNAAAPVYMGNGQFNLLVMRRITGLYNADLIGYVQEFLAYKDGVFAPYFTCVCTV